MTTKLYKKFMQGFINLGYNIEDLQSFNYCGGDKERHLKYFKLKYGDNILPLDHEEHCICGHKIEENCYITNDINILVIGNCCIKKFIKNSGRTCEICKQPHKNRKVNRCNNCRIGVCDECENECNIKYKLCYNCFNENRKYEINKPKIYLSVLYHEKESLKEFGGRWDDDLKKWYIFEDSVYKQQVLDKWEKIDL